MNHGLRSCHSSEKNNHNSNTNKNLYDFVYAYYARLQTLCCTHIQIVKEEGKMELTNQK